MKDKIVFYATPYKGYYCTRDGVVLNAMTKYILKGKHDKDGYLEYALTVDGRQIYKRGHRIVAETFLPNPLNKPTVNHKNGVRDDNRVENLEWNTYSENNYHRYKVLHATPPGKYSIDIIYKGKLVDEDCSMEDCNQAGIPKHYLRAVMNNDIKSFYCYYEKCEDGSMNRYWNGECTSYSSIAEASKQLNIVKHGLYRRCCKHKDIELIARDYTFVFRENKV